MPEPKTTKPLPPHLEILGLLKKGKLEPEMQPGAAKIIIDRLIELAGEEKCE